MFLQASFEDRLKELEKQNERLEIEVNDFFASLNVSSEQIAAFLSEKNNFSEETWEDLVKEKTRMEEQLTQRLENVRNPKKIKQSYDSLHVGRHWLPVR